MAGIPVQGSANVDQALQEARAISMKSLAQMTPMWPMYATEVPSNTLIEHHIFNESMGKVVDWVGDANYQDLRMNSVTAENKPFVYPIALDRYKIEDYEGGSAALPGFIAAVAANTGPAFASHQDDLAVDVLINGFTAACYDGQNFFSNSHPTGTAGVTQDNLQTGALTATTYDEAEVLLASLTDWDGKPMKMKAKWLIVGPSNKATAKTILEADRDASGATNIFKGDAQVLVLPELIGTYAGYWFVVAGNVSVGPVIFQKRYASPNSREFEKPENNTIYLRYDDRYVAVQGLWQSAVGSTG